MFNVKGFIRGCTRRELSAGSAAPLSVFCVFQSISCGLQSHQGVWPFGGCQRRPGRNGTFWPAEDFRSASSARPTFTIVSHSSCRLATMTTHEFVYKNLKQVSEHHSVPHGYMCSISEGLVADIDWHLQCTKSIT